MIAIVGFFSIPNTVIYNYDIVNVTYAMVGFILITLFCYEGDIVRKLSAVFILYPIIVSLNLITMSLKTELYFAIERNEKISNLFDIFIQILTVLIWYFIYTKFHERIESAGKRITLRVWILIDIICVTPLISIVATIINTPYGKDMHAYPTAIACILTNLGIIFLVGYILEKEKLSHENETLRLQFNYYSELEKNQLEVRKLRHDMNNHISVIASFLEKNEISKAKDYFSTLYDMFPVSNHSFCKNSILNAVLNLKYNVAVQNGIDCFFRIEIDEILSINDVDLCSLFSNTLDNAIEAVLKIDNTSLRRISMKARCDKGYFSYSIMNSKQNDIKEWNGRIRSDKTEGKEHGFGLLNVKDIVEKYHGTLDITYTEDDFTVLVIIKI
jgi:sensor histidine kinase YesM